MDAARSAPELPAVVVRTLPSGRVMRISAEGAADTGGILYGYAPAGAGRGKICAGAQQVKV